jgi:hypothetical protein
MGKFNCLSVLVEMWSIWFSALWADDILVTRTLFCVW